MRLGRVTKLRLAPHFEWYKKVIQKAMTLVFFFFFASGAVEGYRVWGRGKACLPSTRESFVFPKHKAWKWLRMEPPNHHCLGWEWVSRKCIGWVVVGTPSGSLPARHLLGIGSSCVCVGGRQKRCHSLPVVCTYRMPGDGCGTGPSL